MVKKRILFVFHVPFIPMNGGVERVTDILSRIFLKKGYEVFYLNNIRRNSDFVYPVKQFYFPDTEPICRDMKKITLDKIIHVLRTGQNQAFVPEAYVPSAGRALEQMLKLAR